MKTAAPWRLAGFTAFLLIFLLPGKALPQDEDDSFKRWAAFYKTVRTEVRSKDYRIQLAAVEKFTGQDYPEAAEYLIELIERRDPNALVAKKAAEVLGGYQDKAARQLLKDAVESRPAANRYLLMALAAQNEPDCNPIAVKALADAKSPATLTVAIQAIGKNSKQDESVVDQLIERLDEENYHTVRKAAAETLGKIESKKAISALIEGLEDRLLAEYCRDSLLRLTGQEHWTDIGAWFTWWQANGDSFEPDPLDDADFKKLRSELLAKNGDGLGGGMAAEFYGKKLKGKYILFLLDSSGSMELEGRMDRMKHELKFMIEQMAEDYRFGFVMFPIDNFPSRGIEPAKERFKDRALRFVERLAPNGGTPMGEALQMAFDETVPEYNVDTIYLLSDGEPTDLIPDIVQDFILERNEPLGVTIHTIWVGGEGRDLLKEIAELNGGQFWEAP